jgi:hypothetical protein
MGRIFYCGLFILLFLAFFSCKPTGGIDIYNKLDNVIFYECKTIYDDIDLSPYKGSIKIVNSNVIKNNKYKSLINIFSGDDIIEEFGFGSINRNEDVIKAIENIFIEIYIYEIINDENIIILDKSYFLKSENFKINGNNIVYTIK